jgi:Uncharacterised nucleotidyltransferase
MPSSTLDDLVDAYARVSVSNQRMLGAFGTLAEYLRREGIEFILLKGADVLTRLYGAWGLRAFCDIDLLVHERDLTKLDRLLRNLGFDQQIDGNPSYCSSEQSLRLDIITSIWYLDEPAMQDLWRRRLYKQSGHFAYHALSGEDLFLFLVAYSVVHRAYLSDAFWNDLALLTAREPLNWTRLLDSALRAHLKVPLYFALTISHSQSRSILHPPEALAPLAPRTIGERLLNRLLHRLVTSEEIIGLGHVLLWITQPPRRWLPWCAARLFPDDTFLRYRYGPTGEAHPFRTRLRRLLQLGSGGLRLSIRIAHRLMNHHPTTTRL